MNWVAEVKYVTMHALGAEVKYVTMHHALVAEVKYVAEVNT
jgi:hypothetical protein